MILLAIVIGALFAVGMAAITLEDPCALDTVVPGTGCINCLSETEKKILLIYAKNQILATLLLGNAYTLDELRTLAKCFACQSDSVLLSEQVRVWGELGVTMVRGFPTTTAAIADQVKCFCNISQHELDAMLLVLDCKLAQKLQPILL